MSDPADPSDPDPPPLNRARTREDDDPFGDLGIDKKVDFKQMFKFNRKAIRPWLPSPYDYRKGVAYPRSFAKRLHLFLTDPQASKLGERAIEVVFAVIIISCVSFIVETLPVFLVYSKECEVCKPLRGDDRTDAAKVDVRKLAGHFCRTNNCEPTSPPFFGTIEMVCVCIFAADYLVRLFTAHSIVVDYEKPLGPSCLSPVRKTIKYAIEWMNIVDLIAIVPFFVELGVSGSSVSLSVVRVLRLLRIVRMFRFGRFSSGMLLFLQVIRSSLMAFLIIIVFTLFGMVVFGSLVYYAERGTWDPETGLYKRVSLIYTSPLEYTPYTSIPTSFWWVLVTFTTVGYGDMYPTSPGGRFIGVMCMYVGVLFISMPITVVGANFADAYLEQKREAEKQEHRNRVRARALHQLLFMRRMEAYRRGWNTWMSVVQQMKKQENDMVLQLSQAVASVVSQEIENLRRLTTARLERLEQQAKASTK